MTRTGLAGLFLLLLTSVAHSQNVPAQTDQQTILKLQTSIQQLQEQINNQTLQNVKDVATLRSQIQQANYPQGNAKGIEGSVSAEKSFDLAQMIQAYRASDELCGQIVERHKNTFVGKTVFLTTSATAINQFVARKATQEQLSNFQAKYTELRTRAKKTIDETKKIIDKKSSEHITATASSAFDTLLDSKSIVSNVIDLIQFFQSKTSYQFGDVDLDHQAVAAQMLTHLQDEKVNVKYLDLHLFVPHKTSSIRTLLSDVDKAKTLTDSQLDALDQASALTFPDKNHNAQDDQKLKVAEDSCKQAKAEIVSLDSAFTALRTTLYTSDASGWSPLLNFDATEDWYNSLIGLDKAYIFYVNPLKAGGSTRTMSNLFNSGSISYSGGLVLSYFIYDNQGNLVSCDLTHNHKGWQRMKDEGGGEIPQGVKSPLP